MKRNVIRLTVAGTFVFGLALLAIRAQPAPNPAAQKSVLLSASELKWVDAPDRKGVREAVIWGNREKGQHGAFTKFAAGTEIPLHTHTATGRTVVIAGTMVEGVEGQKAKELGPGSYFSIPGEVKHTTSCKAGAECIVYSEWSGGFDLKPARP